MFTETELNEIDEIGKAFPCQLVVVLYDQVIASLIDAIDAIGKGDIEARFNATTEASNVISQLYLALDMEEGGDIAESLGSLYNYILTQLPKINFDNDPTIAEQAIKLLRPVRESWFELDERIRADVETAESLSEELAATVVARDAMAAKGIY